MLLAGCRKLGELPTLEAPAEPAAKLEVTDQMCDCEDSGNKTHGREMGTW